MPTTARRFFNIKACTHGAVEVNTVQSITLRRNYTRLTGRGDNDKSVRFSAKTGYDVSGTIVLQDPVQADALLDAARGALTWQGETEGGGQEKQHTVTGVEFFTLDETDSHQALDAVTLGWNAVSADGQTDPVTTGLVAP